MENPIGLWLNQGKLNTRTTVLTTERLQTYFLHGEAYLCLSLRPWDVVYDDKSALFTWNFLHNAHYISLALIAHSHAAASQIADVLPNGREPSNHIRIAEGLCANDNLTCALPIVHQICCPGLTWGTHQRAHRYGDFTNCIVRAAFVYVDHLKSEVLVALEEVGHSETRLEIWIQVVHDRLCFADLLPCVATLFIQDALGV